MATQERWTGARVRRIVMLATLLAGAFALGPAAANAAAATSVVMFSEPGDYIGQGQPRLYHTGNAAITGRFEAVTSILEVRVSGGPVADEFGLQFAAAPGQPLVPGVYDSAQRAPFRTAGHPGLDIGGDGRGCNAIEGRFAVRDIALNADLTVARLWIVFEQHCEGGPAALFGEVRIGEPVPQGSGFTAPSSVQFPPLDLGAPGAVVPVSFVATAATQIAAVSVAGAQAADFPIRLNECTGMSLAPGGVCQVFVRFRPAAPGPSAATLRFTDTAGASYDVPLHGFGIGGRTAVVLRSEPGDFIGGGIDRVYTPANASIHLLGGGSRSHVAVAVDGADAMHWIADFAAGAGDILGPAARYAGATRYPFNTSGPGLDVSGGGRGCNALTGEFTVTSASFGPDARPRTLSISFVQHCDGAVAALRGTFDFRAGAALPDAAVVLLGAGAPSVASAAAPSATQAVAGAARRAGARAAVGACVGSRFAAARTRRGTPRGERIVGGRRSDVILAGGGNDRVLARGSNDCVDGGAGADVLAGGPGADVLVGGAGRDRLSGGTGPDRLSAGAGADRLDGGPGRDVLDCGAGRDVARATRGDATRGCERVLRR